MPVWKRPVWRLYRENWNNPAYGGGREQPDMILVCGGCANIPGIADVISSRVGIPTEVGDPLGQMKISSKAKSQGVHKDATAILTACGLALRSFD